MDRPPAAPAWIRTLVRGLALAPVITGLVVLAQWSLGWRQWGTFGPGNLSLDPITAVLLGLFGLALFGSSQWPDHPRLQRASFWTILLVASVALGLGVQPFIGSHPGGEHLGSMARTFPESRGGIPFGPIPTLSAAGLVLAGLSCVAIPPAEAWAPRFRSGRLALGLASLMATLALLLVLTTLSGVSLLYGTGFIQPALLSSLMILALGLGLCCRALPHLELMHSRDWGGFFFLGISALVAVALFTTTFIYLHAFETEHRRDLGTRLLDIAALKTSQLELYRKERMADAAMMMNAPGLSEMAWRAFQSPPGSLSELQMQDWMDRCRATSPYSLIQLLDGRGHLRLSSPSPGMPLSEAISEEIPEILRLGTAQFQDLYWSEQDQQSHLALLVPLRKVNARTSVQGVLVLRTDATAVLYPFLDYWPTPSPTAETLLAKRSGDEVIYLNRPRFSKMPPLSLRFPIGRGDLPAVRAVLGQEGLTVGVDYRGKEVVAILRRVPDSPWYLVAKVDESEFLGPVQKYAWQVLGLTFLLFMVIGTCLSLLWHQQHLTQMRESILVEKALVAAEAKYHAIFDNSVEGMLQVTPDGQLHLANPALAHMMGFDSAEALLRGNHDFSHHYFLRPERQKEFLETLKQRGEVSAFEHEVVKLDGSVAWVSESSRAVRDETGQIQFYEGVLEDITLRKRIEGELAETRATLQAAMDQSPAGMAIADAPNGLLRYVNQAGLLLRGGDLDTILNGVGALKYVESWRLLDLDGRPLEALEVPLARAVLLGESCTREFMLHRENGEMVIVRAAAAPIRNADGAVVSAIVVFDDISQQRRAEQEINTLNHELEARVQQRTAELQTSIKELEAFSYSVSHDLRAPLRHVTGFVELMNKMDPSGLDATRRHYLEVISGAAIRMGRLIDELLSFSRMGRGEMLNKPVDLNPLTQEVIEELAKDLPAGRVVDWRVGRLPMVIGDQAMLRLVLVNLFSNALKYSSRVEHSVIELGTLTEDPHEGTFYVRDNGIGFDMKYVDKLFGLFQRLHSSDEYEGTGIGLANIRRIISRHGGRTWAEGELNKGATFYFTLPLYQEVCL